MRGLLGANRRSERQKKLLGSVQNGTESGRQSVTTGGGAVTATWQSADEPSDELGHRQSAEDRIWR